MPKISFKSEKKIQAFEVAYGTPLMAALLSHGQPVASSCNGQGVCSKCHVRVLKGHDNLSTETNSETQLKKRNKVPEGHRISCQTQVLGDIVIDTDYW
jgi:2Fe-2S ferredoxin